MTTPKDAAELDALCRYTTPPVDADAVGKLLEEVAEYQTTRDDLLCTLHSAITDCAWRFRDADEHAKNAAEAESDREFIAMETAAFLTLLNLVVAVHPAKKPHGRN